MIVHKVDMGDITVDDLEIVSIPARGRGKGGVVVKHKPTLITVKNEEDDLCHSEQIQAALELLKEILAKEQI